MNEEEEQSRPSGAPEASGSGGGPVDPDAGAGAPNEEELRRRLEDELRKLRVQDVLLQSVVSLINLTSRRIAKQKPWTIGTRGSASADDHSSQ